MFDAAKVEATVKELEPVAKKFASDVIDIAEKAMGPLAFAAMGPEKADRFANKTGDIIASIVYEQLYERVTGRKFGSDD